MARCPYLIPNFDVHLTPDGEALQCLREDRHDLHGGKEAEHHLVRLEKNGTYVMWYYDYEDEYEHKTDEDFVHYEISEEEAKKYMEGVTE